MIRKAVQEFFSNNSRLITTLLYFVLGVFLIGSLASFSASDPSFNRASGNGVQNIFGTAGAYIADPLYQFFGLSAFLIPMACITVALRLIFKTQRFNLWFTNIFLFVSLLSVSALIVKLNAPETWPFYVGLGGFFGDLVSKSEEILTIYGYISLFAFIAATCSYFAFGIRLSEIRKTFGIVYYIASKLKYLTASFILMIVNLGRKSMKKEPVALDISSFEDTSEDYEDYIVEVKEKKEKKRKKKVVKQKTLRLDPGEFELPDFDLLTEAPDKGGRNVNQKSLEQNAKLLKKVLEDFGVKGNIVKVRPGPVVTLYELEPSPGTKSSRVIGLADDIARSMSAVSTRISVVPGKNILGIELPNADRETVYLRELMECEEYRDERIKLPIALGKDIGGEPVMADLSRMPHLLIAGTTGSGKSVAVNAMILSYLYRLTPDECKFIMIDPKMLELSVYEGIPHLLSPVVTEPKKAVVALKWAVREMEERYRLMSNVGVRNITGYNKKIEEAVAKGKQLERTVQTGFDPETGEPTFEKQPLAMTKLPFIVVIVDEMADLMLTAGKDIESSIQRLAQMARAAGIHMVMATQRPSVDVITGVIKANFPTRISFQVTSRIDSRTILGEMGAEQLLGMGDMLYMAGGSRITRVHGPFVDDKEVDDVVKHLKAQGKPSYVTDITRDDESSDEAAGANSGDDLYDQAVAIVLRDKKASTSYIQRQLKIGYNRAANLIDKMESEGIISEANHSGKRQVLAA
ncbi:MAG: cell division protein FtsK [Alphaproteobacteria bacterium CG11_big_fil_rev_8_21_14_0_20_39_49]|nr:MAG: cell division protein FtsK [Alphaproteobacteria bacterium CG11_big_fil_rev_8_21_14_0_20_39_49]